MLNKISSMLDAVADSLEKKGFIKEAYEIDKIADEWDTMVENDLAGRGRKKTKYVICNKNEMYLEGTKETKFLWTGWHTRALEFNTLEEAKKTANDAAYLLNCDVYIYEAKKEDVRAVGEQFAIPRIVSKKMVEEIKAKEKTYNPDAPKKPMVEKTPLQKFQERYKNLKK